MCVIGCELYNKIFPWGGMQNTPDRKPKTDKSMSTIKVQQVN